MAWTEYTAQTQVVGSGTLEIKIRSDAAAITWPSEPTIIEIGEIETSYDPLSGWIQLPTCRFKYLEVFGTGYEYGLYDYLFYSGNVEIVLTLTEGVTSRVIFWGFPDYVQAWNDELDTTTPVRTGEFHCVDILTMLWKSPLSETIEDILTNTRYSLEDRASGTNKAGITVAEIISAMLYNAGINGTHASTDVTWANDDEFRAKCSEGALEWDNVPAGDMFIWIGGQLVDSPYTFTPEGIFDSGDADYLPKYYHSCGSFLEVLCKTFGVVPRRYYSGGRHLIVLESMGRGDEAALATIDGGVLSSQFYSRTPVRATSVLASSEVMGIPGWLKTEDGWTATYGGTTRDADITVDSLMGGTPAVYMLSPGYEALGYTYFLAAESDGWDYWDYEAAAQSSDMTWLEALTGYVYGRLAPIKSAVERRYSSASLTVSPTSTVANAFPGITTSMSLRGSSTVFYAISVKKNLVLNECTIMWYER